MPHVAPSDAQVAQVEPVPVDPPVPVETPPVPLDVPDPLDVLVVEAPPVPLAVPLLVELAVLMDVPLEEPVLLEVDAVLCPPAPPVPPEVTVLLLLQDAAVAARRAPRAAWDRARARRETGASIMEPPWGPARRGPGAWQSVVEGITVASPRASKPPSTQGGRGAIPRRR